VEGEIKHPKTASVWQKWESSLLPYTPKA
jgi:hypothetical protein